MDNTFAVGPDGSIYPCYRFVGMPKYVMGNVRDHPSMEDLAQSEAWKHMHQFKDYVNSECKRCKHIRYCRGGCPYNAMVPSSGEIKGVDPHCVAYKRIFDEITDRFNREILGGFPGMEMGVCQSGAPRNTGPGIMTLMQKIISK